MSSIKVSILGGGVAYEVTVGQPERCDLNGETSLAAFIPISPTSAGGMPSSIGSSNHIITNA